MSDEPRKWPAPPKHVLELSYGHKVANYWQLKRETPPLVNNLTPSERRLLELGRLSWKEWQPITEQQRDWQQQARGPRR